MQPYPIRVVEAYRQVDMLGLVGYWRGLVAFALAAGDLAELEKHWQYCVRVSDHTNPLYKDLARITKERKEELSHDISRIGSQEK